MSDQTDKYINILQPFGLSSEESKIYLILLQNGFLSALSISRQIKMGRTKVYRILDKLIARRLVEQKLDDLGLKFGATDPTKLEQLVLDREYEAKALKESLPSVISGLQNLNTLSSGKSKVLYYHGAEGLTQLSYNTTRAKTELLTYESAHDMSAWIPRKQAETIRQEFVNNNVHIKELSFNKSFDNFTTVPDFALKHWQVKYLDPKLLELHSEAAIYDDVFVVYNFAEGFGVEIHDHDIANMQRQIFGYLWNHAQPMKILSPEGKAVLEQ